VTNVEVTGRVIGQGYVPPLPHTKPNFLSKKYIQGGRRGIPLPHRGLGPRKKIYYI